MADEFPDATIFSYRLFSDLLTLLDAGDLSRALESHVYGLQPAFVDGWLDVAPASLRVVEGTEEAGYRANDSATYHVAYARLRLRLPEFVSPENREKLRRQFFIGQSLYLDAYVAPPGHAYRLDLRGSTPASRLAANLRSALEACDAPVWIYGEQGKWWPSGGSDYSPWPEKFPGLIGAMQRAKDPPGFAQRVLDAAEPGANVLPNAEFEKTAGTSPEGWFTWQADDSHGDFACARGIAEVRGARHGVFGCTVKTRPGAVFAARLRARTHGHATAALAIGWKTADGKWTAHDRNARFVATRTDAEGWQEISHLVEVPPDAGQLVFTAAAHGSASPEDRCEFDKAALILIE